MSASNWTADPHIRNVQRWIRRYREGTLSTADLSVNLNLAVTSMEGHIPLSVRNRVGSVADEIELHCYMAPDDVAERQQVIALLDDLEGMIRDCS